MHWEAYPHHQFMHTVGALPCCSKGGCWKSRCQPVGDDDPKDENLCTYPVKVSDTLQIGKCQTMITPQIVSEAISMHYEGGMLKYNNFMMPTGMEPELDKRDSVMLAKYVVERFRPRIMLDLGCKRTELLKTIYKTGIDIYGLRSETEIIITDEEFPASRISSFDLATSYWKSPVKFDLIWTGSALEFSGRTADNVADTILSNLKKGGVLVVTPPPQAHEAALNWIDDWIERLSKIGLTMLEDETDRLRRVTHRVGNKGTELVFMRL